MPGFIQGAMMPRQEAQPLPQRRPNAPMQPAYPQMPGVVQHQGRGAAQPGRMQHQAMPRQRGEMPAQPGGSPVDEVHARYQNQMQALKRNYDARMRQLKGGGQR